MNTMVNKGLEKGEIMLWDSKRELVTNDSVWVGARTNFGNKISVFFFKDELDVTKNLKDIIFKEKIDFNITYSVILEHLHRNGISFDT